MKKFEQEVDYAFPLTYYREGKIQEQPGMRLIDYFAAEAMRQFIKDSVGESHEEIAKGSYLIAEAIMKESKNH